MSTTGLEDAALVLDALAAGITPDRARAVAGASALDALILFSPWGASLDLLDAAGALRVVATGGTLDLTRAGRRRARQLAEAVRASVGREREELPAVSYASHYS